LLFIRLEAGGCYDPHPVGGKPNMRPILDLTGGPGPNMVLLGTVPNGKIYQVTVPNDGGNTTATYTLVHVWGSYYDMGYANAKLHQQFLNTSLNDFFTSAWEYLEEQVTHVLPGWFPKWLDDAIAILGLDGALDITEMFSKMYTDPKIYEELQGLSDGGGIDYQTLVRVHMIAGLTQGACSMFGIWGSALKNPNTLLQLRALDWDMKGPFRDQSQITVYHPNDGTNSHINIGIAGFVGGLTGISETQLGISEIGASYPDASFGAESRIGVPFIFLLRNVLMYDVTVDDAINRMINARRTCDLMLGVGDGKSNEFRGMQYSYSVLNVFDDTNLQPLNNTWHPRIPKTVYWGMDWICPGYNTLLSQQLIKYTKDGQMTPEIAISYVSPVEKSGDNQVAIYDLTNMKFWVSFAAPHSVSGDKAAYDRQYVKYDAWKLLRETKP